jgi:hypothetical protein
VAGFILPKFLKRQRRNIFVAPNPVVRQAPSGAKSSEYIAPDGAWEFNGAWFYKDFAPAALTAVQKHLTLAGAGVTRLKCFLKTAFIQSLLTSAPTFSTGC